MAKGVESYARFGLLGLIALMPFHAFLAVFLGHLWSHQMIWQAWKEVLILVLGVIVLVHPKFRKTFLEVLKRPLNLLIIAFAVLAFIVSLANGHFETSFWFGIKTDLEFLALFVIAQTLADNWTERSATKLILIGASAVAAFGTLQATLLPPDFLANFGYGPLTIVPYELITSAGQQVRILSTLGGPNQLGSFLILPASLILHLLLKRRRWILLLPLALTLFTLWHTFSRSAWIGMLAAATTVVILNLPRRALAPALLAVTLVIGATAIFGVRVINSSSLLQKYLVHGELKGTQVNGPDSLHLLQVQEGIAAVRNQPLGYGLGTAGPASFRNQAPFITENYYLQIAVETGILGLLLFLGICLSLGLNLARLVPSSTLAAPLLGALIGVSLVNLFLHGWADSSTALVFWGTAGIALRQQK